MFANASDSKPASSDLSSDLSSDVEVSRAEPNPKDAEV